MSFATFVACGAMWSTSGQTTLNRVPSRARLVDASSIAPPLACRSIPYIAPTVVFLMVCAMLERPDAGAVTCHSQG